MVQQTSSDPLPRLTFYSSCCSRFTLPTVTNLLTSPSLSIHSFVLFFDAFQSKWRYPHTSPTHCSVYCFNQSSTFAYGCFFFYLKCTHHKRTSQWILTETFPWVTQTLSRHRRLPSPQKRSFPVPSPPARRLLTTQHLLQ